MAWGQPWAEHGAGATAMTPADLAAARKQLGLSQAGLAAALRMGKHGGRTVRRWELGEIEVPGPVAVAVELMLREKPPADAGAE